MERRTKNSFRKAQKIKSWLDVKKILKTGKKWNCSWCSIYSIENGINRNRGAIVVPKKTGTAVQRNKVKRQFREFFRRYLKETPLRCDILIQIYPTKEANESKEWLEKALSLWIKKQKKE